MIAERKNVEMLSRFRQTQCCVAILILRAATYTYKSKPVGVSSINLDPVQHPASMASSRASLSPYSTQLLCTLLKQKMEADKATYFHPVTPRGEKTGWGRKQM